MPANNYQRIALAILLLLMTTIVFLAYGGSIFLITSKAQDTDLKTIYLSGKMLNLHVAAYHFSQKYVTSHHLKKDVILNLAPPFTTWLATTIAKHISYKNFFGLFMSITLIANIINLARLYLHFYSKKYIYVGIFILANLVYMPTMLNINFGQVGLLLNALLISAYLALENKQEKWAGCLFAIAANIKIFCGIFLFYLLFSKKKSAFISMLLCCLLLTIIPLAIYGPSIYLGYIKTLSKVYWYGTNWNASFYGFFSRALGDPNHKFHTLLHYESITKFFYYGTFITYLSLLYYFSKKDNTSPTLLFSFTLSSMLLISPLGWTYYFPLLITALLINLNATENNKNAPFAFCLMLFSLLLSSLIFPLYKKIIPPPQELLLKGNSFFWALLLLNLATIVLFYGKTVKNFLISTKLKIGLYAIALLPSIFCMTTLGVGQLHALLDNEENHATHTQRFIAH